MSQPSEAEAGGASLDGAGGLAVMRQEQRQELAAASTSTREGLESGMSSIWDKLSKPLRQFAQEMTDSSTDEGTNLFAVCKFTLSLCVL